MSAVDQDALIPTASAATSPRKGAHPYARLDTKGGRGVRCGRCRDCRAPILTGLDGDTCAFVARVDCTPLTPLGEVLALLQDGVRTYELRTPGQAFARLVRRDFHAIRSRPAETGRFDVLADHRCHAAVPEVAVAVTRLAVAPRPVPPIDPPF